MAMLSTGHGLPASQKLIFAWLVVYGRETLSFRMLNDRIRAGIRCGELDYTGFLGFLAIWVCNKCRALW